MRDVVEASQATPEACREFRKEQIPDGVAIQIVDRLETVHVEIQERKGVLAVPVHSCQMLRQAIPEEQSIGESSQLVVERHPNNLETARGLGCEELQGLKLLVLDALRRVRHEYVGDIVT